MTQVILPIASIRLDFQPVDCLDVETVHAYAETLRAGRVIVPVTVQFDGQVYWLRDGFHRLAAARSLGRETIEAELVKGTYAEMEAEWKQSLGAALAELRKTNAAEDKNTGHAAKKTEGE
jgi:uncharacterized ParB-like nuclease family protein